MPRIKLTQAAARALPLPEAGQVDYFDETPEPPGFGLRVSHTGARSWQLAYRPRGAKNATRFAIGDANRMPIREARDRAQQLHDQKRYTQIEEPASPAAQSTTFGEVRDRFLLERPHERTKRGAKPRGKTMSSYRLNLTHPALRALDDLPLAEIVRTTVQPVLKKLAGTAPVQANRCLATIRAVLKWAEDHVAGYEAPALGDAPGGTETPRDRVLSDDELKCLLLALDDVGPLVPGTMTANMVGCSVIRVLLHTGTRAGEAAGAQWSEFDAAGDRTWTVPGERTKTHTPRTLPLTKPVLDVLAAVPRWQRRKLKGSGMEPSPFVFSASGNVPFGSDLTYTRGLLEAAAKDHAKRLKLKKAFTEGWTSHDLRRTARTGMAKLGVAPHIAERILGHQRKSIAAVYDRHDYADEIRAALEKWSGHLEFLRMSS